MITELKDTIFLMTSKDYKDRFKAEFYQTKIRYNKLKQSLDNIIKDNLSSETYRSILILELQAQCMKNYLDILVSRAINEGIEIEYWKIKDI